MYLSRDAAGVERCRGWGGVGSEKNANLTFGLFFFLDKRCCTVKGAGAVGADHRSGLSSRLIIRWGFLTALLYGPEPWNTEEGGAEGLGEGREGDGLVATWGSCCKGVASGAAGPRGSELL